MKSLLVILFSLLLHINIFGQIDSIQVKMRIDSIEKNQEKWLHRGFGSPYEYPPVITESTISLVPEFQMGSKPYFSFSISKDLLKLYRKGGFSAKNLALGLEYNHQNKIFAPKIAFSQSIFFVHYRLNALYYLTKVSDFIAIRPEIGFNFNRLYLSFGRNIFFKQIDLNTINKWSISAYYYFPILPWK